MIRIFGRMKEIILVQLIKKGGLRERANRSSKYAHSENNIKTLHAHRYTTQDTVDSIENDTESQPNSAEQLNIEPDKSR